MKRKRKLIPVAVITALMVTAFAGCSKEQDAVVIFSTENKAGEETQQQSQGEAAEPGSIPESALPADEDVGNGNALYSLPETGSNQEAIFIGGKVRSVGEDEFVISRTLMDDDGFIVMPEAGRPEEVLVTVQCAESTSFEHWTIQNGGGDVVRKEAAFSDIQEGAGLEAWGYFDGEEFIAEKIIIEVYQ